MGGHEMRGRFARVRRGAFFVGLAVWAASCGCGAETVTPPSCALSLSPSGASQPASGGQGSLTVTTAAKCSWIVTSEVDWVTVAGDGHGTGNGTVTYAVAPNTGESARSTSLRAANVNGQSAAALHQITQDGTTAQPWARVYGAYTFYLEADPTCGWPVTTFLWPVSVDVTSYVEGTTVGAVVFPPTPAAQSNRWSLHASPTGTQLVPAPDSPGAAAAAYSVVVDGGRWEAGGPTRSHDGRGEISSGTATGTKLTLVLPGSDQRWECRADAKWRMIARWVDWD